jgi:hypothetical protein
MSSATPKGPYRLVTVNNAPERAKRVIGQVVEELKDRYTIDYVANCIGILQHIHLGLSKSLHFIRQGGS